MSEAEQHIILLLAICTLPMFLKTTLPISPLEWLSYNLKVVMY